MGGADLGFGDHVPELPYPFNCLLSTMASLAGRPVRSNLHAALFDQLRARHCLRLGFAFRAADHVKTPYGSFLVF